jgi:hypothetical protein
MGIWQGVDHGLPKVLPRPTMLELSMLSMRAIPETALHFVSGVSRPQGRWPAAIFHPFGHQTLCAYVNRFSCCSSALGFFIHFIPHFCSFVCSVVARSRRSSPLRHHRRTARGVQGGRRCLQAACPEVGLPLKPP